MQRLRLLEWVVVVIGAWVVWNRVAARRQAMAPVPTTALWVIDACVILAIGGVVGGAVTGLRWLALIGFGAAVLGLILSLKHGLRRISRWMRSWWRTEK